jgi:hypothetical protein
MVWPEVELNSTFFHDGKNDGQKQNFVTPGLVMGAFTSGEESALPLAADTRLPRLTFIPRITAQFCRFAFRSDWNEAERASPVGIMTQSLIDIIGLRKRWRQFGSLSHGTRIEMSSLDPPTEQF